MPPRPGPRQLSVKELSQIAPNQRGDRPAQGRGPPEETRIQAFRGPCPEWASTGLAVRPSSWPDSADSVELREAAPDLFFVPPSRPAWSGAVNLRTFSAPLPKRFVLSAFARIMRL